MSPAEDAALLLRIVRRHLQAMRLNLDPAYPDEEWGFQAQQALEKLLKAAVVLRNQAPERTHVLQQLARQLGEPLPAELIRGPSDQKLKITRPPTRARSAASSWPMSSRPAALLT